MILLLPSCDGKKPAAVPSTANSTRAVEPWGPRNAAGTDALAKALNSNNAEEMERLLVGGINPNVVMMDGTTLLHGAVGMRQIACVKALLRHGADMSVRDLKGQTPLHKATYYSGDVPELVTVLLQAGAEAHVKDAANMTALDYAVKNGHKSSAELLRNLGERGG